MAFAQWWESTFSNDKFSAQKALRYVKKEYQSPYTESNFDSIFLDLAKDEIDQRKRLLSVEEIERLAARARVQARHNGRNRNAPAQQTSTYKEGDMVSESMPRTIGTLSKETYDRLDKQIQIIKTTTNPLLSEGELGTVRNLKLKTTQETIQKIVQELANQAKARGTSQNLERAYRLEMNRWTELAQKLNARLDRKVSTLEFKEYVNTFDKSFQETRRQAK